MLSLIRPRRHLRLLTILSLLLAGWMSVLVTLVQPTFAAPAGAPAPVSPADKNASAPAVAMTQQGSIHIVWEQDGGLWYRNWRNGAWSTIEQVAAEGETPTLAADPYGEIVYLAWGQEFGGNYEIFSRKWDSVNGWSASHNVSSNDGGSSSPDLAVGRDGKVHLIWADTTPGASVLYHAISADGESWPVALPIPNAKGGEPAIAIDADGVLQVAWQYRASFAENLRIWTTSYENGAWQSPLALTDGARQAFAPDMAANSGRVALAWQEGSDVKLASLRTNGWQVAVTQNGEDPAVTLAGNGGLEWAWETNAGLSSQFGWDSLTTPASWSDPSGTDLALASAGDAIGVVWVEKQGDKDLVFYKAAKLTTMYQPLVKKQ